jgi:hypothetical protein
MITERAMLAAVHISIWTAVKHDSKVSRRSPRGTEPMTVLAGTTSNCCVKRRG